MDGHVLDIGNIHLADDPLHEIHPRIVAAIDYYNFMGRETKSSVRTISNVPTEAKSRACTKPYIGASSLKSRDRTSRLTIAAAFKRPSGCIDASASAAQPHSRRPSFSTCDSAVTALTARVTRPPPPLRVQPFPRGEQLHRNTSTVETHVGSRDCSCRSPAGSPPGNRLRELRAECAAASTCRAPGQHHDQRETRASNSTTCSAVAPRRSRCNCA